MAKENPPTKPAGAAPKRVNLEELAKQMLKEPQRPFNIERYTGPDTGCLAAYLRPLDSGRS